MARQADGGEGAFPLLKAAGGKETQVFIGGQRRVNAGFMAQPAADGEMTPGPSPAAGPASSPPRFPGAPGRRGSAAARFSRAVITGDLQLAGSEDSVSAANSGRSSTMQVSRSACSMKANSLIQTVFYVVAKYGLRRAGDATLTAIVRPRQLRDIGVA